MSTNNNSTSQHITDNNSITHNIVAISQKIRKAEQKASRPEHSVDLLAVSKTQPVDAIKQAIQAGQYRFGENYVQEGVEKIITLDQDHTVTISEAQTKLEWHFIGPIQSNKTRLIAEHFDWVHSIERTKIAQRLNDQRTKEHPLQVLIQINISQEISKSGITAEQVFELAEFIETLPKLNLRGIMAIPEPCDNYHEQKKNFDAMFDIYQTLKDSYPQVDTLSMGMSNDMEAAIAAGSTMVRIGTAIFGSRQ